MSFMARPINLKTEVWERIDEYLNKKADEDRSFKPNRSLFLEEAAVFYLDSLDKPAEEESSGDSSDDSLDFGSSDEESSDSSDESSDEESSEDSSDESSDEGSSDDSSEESSDDDFNFDLDLDSDDKGS